MRQGPGARLSTFGGQSGGEGGLGLEAQVRASLAHVLPTELHLCSSLSGSPARTLQPHPQVLRPGEARTLRGKGHPLRAEECSGLIQQAEGRKGPVWEGIWCPFRFPREAWGSCQPLLRWKQGRVALGHWAEGWGSGREPSSALTDHQRPGGGPCRPEDATGLPPAADRRPGGEQSD